MAAIVLDRIRKVFAGGHLAVVDLDLRVADGERLVLVGPSGSGKSTVLRLIAGLEHPTAGRVLIDGRDVTETPPERRDLAMVFQSYALYPHKTVRDNLAFGLRMRGMPRADIHRAVAATASTLGIADLLDRKPAQLSGGQRQRVALGRAIVRQPQAFLLDEPLSNLDPRLRGETRAELIELHGRLRATMIYVTHDQEEAMTLGERVAVLRDGALEQLTAPIGLYECPSNVFVARFIGSPPMNLLDGRVTIGDGMLAFETADQVIALSAGASCSRPEEVRAIGVRPHDVALLPHADRADLLGRLEVVEPLGHAQIAHVAVGTATRVVAMVPPDVCLRAGDRIGLALNRDRLHFFDGDGRRL